MKAKAPYISRYRHAPPLALMPPNLQSMGAVPFAAADFAILDAWLAEEGWPLERMDAAMLEGYLIALLVWPIELSAGAWLPPIWGIRGWKVAAKIATPEAYNRFLSLVVGFLQELERRLTAFPPLQTFALERDATVLSARASAGSSWAAGFMTALHENSAGLGLRSPSTHSAVEAIARCASLRSIESSSAKASVAATLGAGVATLVGERPSRGALGPLLQNLSGVTRVAQQRRTTVRILDPVIP